MFFVSSLHEVIHRDHNDRGQDLRVIVRATQIQRVRRRLPHLVTPILTTGFSLAGHAQVMHVLTQGRNGS